MSESMEPPNPIPRQGIRILSRLFVIWGALLLLLSIAILLIAWLYWVVDADGTTGVMRGVAVNVLSPPGIVAGLLGILTIISGAYFRRRRPWALDLVAFVTVLRSLAIVALSMWLYRINSPSASGQALLFLIPEIVVTIYLRKFRGDFRGSSAA
jgi:hypothetical protein